MAGKAVGRDVQIGWQDKHLDWPLLLTVITRTYGKMIVYRERERERELEGKAGNRKEKRTWGK